MRRMPSAGVKCMLFGCAWREVSKQQAEGIDRPKLGMSKELVGRRFEVRCVVVKRNEMWRVLRKVGGVSAECDSLRM